MTPSPGSPSIRPTPKASYVLLFECKIGKLNRVCHLARGSIKPITHRFYGSFFERLLWFMDAHPEDRSGDQADDSRELEG